MTFSSECRAGFHCRSASLTRAGTPATTKQLWAEIKWPLKAGPWATLGSPLARSAMLMLLKTEKLASSAAGSAAAAVEIANANRHEREKKRMVFWTAAKRDASPDFFSILKKAHLSHSASVATEAALW